MAKAARLQLGNLNTAHRPYAQRIHAMQRIYKRYGILMDMPEYLTFCSQIKEGKNPSIGPGRAGGTMHIIKHRGKELVAIWTPETDQIATFLPAGTRPCIS